MSKHKKNKSNDYSIITSLFIIFFITVIAGLLFYKFINNQQTISIHQIKAQQVPTPTGVLDVPGHRRTKEYVEVLYPDGGETWCPGETRTIKWWQKTASRDTIIYIGSFRLINGGVKMPCRAEIVKLKDLSSGEHSYDWKVIDTTKGFPDYSKEYEGICGTCGSDLYITVIYLPVNGESGWHEDWSDRAFKILCPGTCQKKGCPLINYSNNCFKVERCEGCTHGLYKNISYRCLKTNQSRNFILQKGDNYPSSYCWETSEALTKLNQVCKCQ